MARGRDVDDLEAEAERLIEPLRALRFARAARGVEDVLDVDLRLRGHAPQDARDERPVSPVGPDRAARLPRVGIAVDAGEPREGFRRTRHQPGVGLEDPHPGAAAPADRGVGYRRRIHLLRLRGRAGSQRLRGRQHVIRRCDAGAEFGVDKVEKAEHVGRLTVTSVLTATRLQAEQHDVPDNSRDLDVPVTAVLAKKPVEDLQYSSRPAETQTIRWLRGLRRLPKLPRLPGLPGLPGLQGSSRSIEVLFADKNLTLGAHEGNTTGVQVVVFFGLVTETADFDRNFALVERLDDDLGLGDGLLLKRTLERVVPVMLSCHFALRN